MGKSKAYALGVDFGTQAGRAILVEVASGQVVGQAAEDYCHGVMDSYLPDGRTKLAPDWALQHPADYLQVLGGVIPMVLREAQVKPQQVIGVAIACTSSTVLPVSRDGTPLCFQQQFQSNPHAYVKLWKHHAAQGQADRLNRLATEREEAFLRRYGGKISSEWMFPKIMQVLEEAPEVYAAAAKFMEAGDWITMMLCGQERRSSCSAGYKAMWSKREGYPSQAFFQALDARMEHVVDEKLSRTIYPIGARAGLLTPAMEEITKLQAGTPVGVAGVDAHVAVPASGIVQPEQLLMIIGTSTCHMILNQEEVYVPGIGGVVEDGIIPGFMGYEAGQACVGDHFQWLVENVVPGHYRQEAKSRGLNIHALLREKAAGLRVGESGLLALDWWNGNRSVLVDADLTGLLLGLTLQTPAEAIYRALIEATAFGTQLIIENFEQHGVVVRDLYACGGIAEKDELLLQIYADVTGREIRTSTSPNTVAFGAAMFAAVAATSEQGGYDTIANAAAGMVAQPDFCYRPKAEGTRVYRQLYLEYRQLHDYFGRGGNDVMKRLKALRQESD